jgi:hypothetical protein
MSKHAPLPAPTELGFPSKFKSWYGAVVWLAGWLEGEGSFTGDRRSPRITVQSSDVDVVELAANILQVPYYAIRKDTKHPTRKPLWYLSVCGVRAIGWMFILYSLMGSRRKDSIRNAVISWHTQRKPGPQKMVK